MKVTLIFILFSTVLLFSFFIQSYIPVFFFFFTIQVNSNAKTYSCVSSTHMVTAHFTCWHSFLFYFFGWTMPFNLLVSTFATNSTDLLQTSLRVQLYNQASGCERWAPGPSLYCPSSAWGQSYWKTGLQSWKNICSIIMTKPMYIWRVY